MTIRGSDDDDAGCPAFLISLSFPTTVFAKSGWSWSLPMVGTFCPSPGPDVTHPRTTAVSFDEFIRKKRGTRFSTC